MTENRRPTTGDHSRSEPIAGRRQTLKYLGLLTATAAGRDFLAAWLPTATAATLDAHAMPGMAQEAPPQPGADSPYVPQFFKPEEFKTVETLTELIIPTDDQPGAREARVAVYIDSVLTAAGEFRPSLQKEWTNGLEILDRLSNEQHGRSFRELSPQAQEQLLIMMSGPERDPQAQQTGYDFYRLVKEMTVEGFYTSRVGLIDVLGYQGLTFLSEFPGCTHPEHQS